ncbi:hypothetical protein HK105_201114 [Polyrhizophydium stewartii]|uniref:Cytidyltransferase-like domain-containing protein n=1 Tax=Polyrhizophydium stewartii TaxID=2732419 RepID=A0ABR4NIV8_9FUNG|nr:hypothetical protein HK105_006548 [Polyrhizophydium stewartii]
MSDAAAAGATAVVVAATAVDSLASPLDAAAAAVAHAARLALALPAPPAVLCILSVRDLPPAGRRAATWRPLARALAALYVAAARESFAAGAPLLPVDVVLDGACGYNVWDFAAERRQVAALVVAGPHAPPALATASFLPGNTVAPVVVGAPSVPAEPASDGGGADEMHQGAFAHVAVGGTFDHMHAGHRILLTITAWLATERIVCGVVDFDPARLRRKAAFEAMEPLDQRLAAVRSFLHQVRRDVVHDVVPIHDDLGPTRDDPAIEALVGSAETAAGCAMVNKIRAEGGLSQLRLFIIDVITSSADAATTLDFSAKISSSYLRKHILDSRVGQPQ